MLLCVHVTSVLFLVLAALTLWVSIEVTLVSRPFLCALGDIDACLQLARP